MASRRAAVHFSTAVHPFLPAPLHPGYEERVFNRSPPSKSAAVPAWFAPTQRRRPHQHAAGKDSLRGAATPRDCACGGPSSMGDQAQARDAELDRDES
jgi:hypothetical protein